MTPGSALTRASVRPPRGMLMVKSKTPHAILFTLKSLLTPMTLTLSNLHGITIALSKMKMVNTFTLGHHDSLDTHLMYGRTNKFGVLIQITAHYQKKGMNTGGMSPEEHTRLNIFLLSESIARTMKNSQDAPRYGRIYPISTPEPAKVEEVIEQPIIEEKVDDSIDGQMTLEDIVIKDVVPDLLQTLYKTL
jgi:hypothetical protein